MNKFWIIVRREYLVRVRQSTFWISTLLTPVGFALLLILPIVAARFTEAENYRVHVYDPGGKVFERLKSEDGLIFVRSEKAEESIKKSIIGTKDEIALILPADLSSANVRATIYSSRSLSLQIESKINTKLKDALREIKLLQVGVEPNKINETKVQLRLSTIKLSEKGEEKTSTIVAAIIGYAMAFIIYFMVFFYGSIVMRGVVEEKTNRIVEIIISSVKPVQLMFGKIVGIAAVSLTQLFLWFLIIMVILIGLNFFLDTGASSPNAIANVNVPPDATSKIEEAITSGLSNFKYSLFLYFLLYFAGGYLLYASLFAAVGSAVDQESDSQQLTGIIGIPVIIPMLFIGNIIQNPNGMLAFWFSIIPFFSPIIMLTRLGAVDVPLWEIGLSLVLLVGGVILGMWIAARIYRIGILLYGKKVTLAELGKWLVARDLN